MRTPTGAFIRDVLGCPHVDAGGGWLIFKVPPAEVAVHPTDGPETHEFHPMCDDVTATVDELTANGVELAKPISDEGWGLLTAIRLPGAVSSGSMSRATRRPTTCDPPPEVGDEVVAIGSPYGLEHTVTRGIVSKVLEAG